MASGGGIITVEYTTGGTATCVQDSEYGQYYILTATPSSGYTFSYWKVMTTNASGSIRYDNGDVSGGGFSYNDQFTYNPMWVQDGMGVDTVFKAFFESVTTTPDNLQTKTTKLINYVKSRLSSKGVTSTATTLRGALDDIANISAGGTQATLNAPMISLSGSTLTLTNPTTNGDFATGFNIYNGTTLLATQLIDVTTLDLSTLLTEEDTYTITAKCYGTNMTESNASSSVSYVMKIMPTWISLESKDNLEFTLNTYNTKENWNGTLEYSINTINWNTWNGTLINSNNGKLYLRGINNTKITGDSSDYRFVLGGSSTAIQCNGNIENLLDYTTVANGQHPTMASYCYRSMFKGCTSLITVPLLSTITLATNCYQSMFSGCTKLTTAPELPAITLADYCYNNMFAGCTSLTVSPQLPATTLADYCYSGMFSSCTSLITAPELPATTLADNCYIGMFSGCTSLKTVPQLPAITLSDSCYQSMFYGCTSLTVVPELPATTLANDCYNSMFSGCTSLTAPPQLLATTLADECYGYMFAGCTSLISTPSLPATQLADECYRSMFNNCTSLTTASQLPATTLTSYCYYSMFSNCTSLATIPSLPATTLANGCYSYMFYGCASLITTPELPATTLADCCYQYMFQDCISLTTVPLLSAMTLTNYCYNYMFIGCTNIKISSTQTSIYKYAWRIPTIGTSIDTNATSWNNRMLYNTGGTFTSNPSINTTYYTNNQPV